MSQKDFYVMKAYYFSQNYLPLPLTLVYGNLRSTFFDRLRWRQRSPYKFLRKQKPTYYRSRIPPRPSSFLRFGNVQGKKKISLKQNETRVVFSKFRLCLLSPPVPILRCLFRKVSLNDHQRISFPSLIPKCYSLFFFSFFLPFWHDALSAFPSISWGWWIDRYKKI